MFLMITKIIVMPYMCVGLWVHTTLFLWDAFGFSQGAGDKSSTTRVTKAPWGELRGTLKVAWPKEGWKAISVL